MSWSQSRSCWRLNGSILPGFLVEACQSLSEEVGQATLDVRRSKVADKLVPSQSCLPLRVSACFDGIDSSELGISVESSPFPPVAQREKCGTLIDNFMLPTLLKRLLTWGSIVKDPLNV